MNYKQLVEALTSQMAKHKMVKESIYALRWEVNEIAKPGRKYFLSALIPTTATVSDPQISYGFQLVVMDIISKTENNKLQIQSDCVGILNDFYNWISDENEFVLSEEPVITVFEENFSDFCAGAGMEFNIAIDNTGSCLLPFNL